LTALICNYLLADKENKSKKSRKQCCRCKAWQDKKSYAMSYTSYVQRSHKFMITSEILKSLKVNSSQLAAVKWSQDKSNVIKSMAVDLGSF